VGARWSKTCGGESLGGAEVRDGEIDAPDVVVVGDGRAGWETAFGEVAIPLGDRGGWFVCEIEALDHVASLPAAVGRLKAAAEELGPMWRVPDPFAGDGDGIDLDRHALGDAGVLELGDQLGDAPILAPSEQLHRFVVLERLDRAIEPDRDVLGVHDPGQAVGHLRELDQPLRALAGG